jgi:hypothetical protein
MRKRASPFLVPFLLLVFFAWLVWSPTQFQNCVQDSQVNYANESFENDTSQFFFIFRGCIGGFVHDNAEGIIALFTVILAISTAFLWKATRDLVDDASETSKKQLRAYIGTKVRGIERYEGSDPARVIGILRIENVGQIPARITGIFSTTEWGPDGNRKEFGPYNLRPSTITLHPRTWMQFGTASQLLFTDITPHPETGKRIGYLYVWGRIDYTDNLGTGGWTNFCHRYPCQMMDAHAFIDRKFGRFNEHGGNEADADQPIE